MYFLSFKGLMNDILTDGVNRVFFLFLPVVFRFVFRISRRHQGELGCCVFAAVDWLVRVFESQKVKLRFHVCPISGFCCFIGFAF